MLASQTHTFSCHCRTSQAIGVSKDLESKLKDLCENPLLTPVMQLDKERTSLGADVFVCALVQLQTTIKASNDAGGKGMFSNLPDK